MRLMAMISTFMLWAWLAGGCQMSESGGKGNEGTPRPQSTNTPTPSQREAQIPAGAESQVARAKEDLSKRVGVSVEEVGVVAVTEVEWSDSSLGCPKPDTMYLQVITPGYRILLAAAGKEYDYHTDKGRTVALCTNY